MWLRKQFGREASSIGTHWLQATKGCVNLNSQPYDVPWGNVSEMTSTHHVEFSNPFGRDPLSVVPEDNAHQPHLVGPLNFSATRRRGRIVGLRSGLYTLAFLLAGGLILICGTLCTIFVLVDDHCDPAYGHYACDISTDAGRLGQR